MPLLNNTGVLWHEQHQAVSTETTLVSRIKQIVGIINAGILSYLQRLWYYFQIKACSWSLKILIISGFSAINKKGTFWYLSYSLRCPTEGGCGDDTHCSSPIISCLKGLVSHLNNTIRHLQSGERSTGKTQNVNRF